MVKVCRFITIEPLAENIAPVGGFFCWIIYMFMYGNAEGKLFGISVHYKMFTKSSQKVSTQVLTWLTISVILHIEQRKRDTKKR